MRHHFDIWAYFFTNHIFYNGSVSSVTYAHPSLSEFGAVCDGVLSSVPLHLSIPAVRLSVGDGYANGWHVNHCLRILRSCFAGSLLRSDGHVHPAGAGKVDGRWNSLKVYASGVLGKDIVIATYYFLIFRCFLPLTIGKHDRIST